MPREAPRGNLGEWSELYALGYLLVNGGAFAADKNQNAIPEVFHKVLQVFLAERAGIPETNYIVGLQDVAILVSGNEVARVERSLIQSAISAMLADLTDGTHRKTFALTTGNEVLKLLRRTRISASSSERENDLEMVLEDQITQSPTTRIGFNIKSQIGGKATLLNASGATNIVFRVMPNNHHNRAPYPNFEYGKHSKNLQALYSSGYHLEFERMNSDIFQENLTLLDMQFPDYLAKVVLHSYLTEEKIFSKAVEGAFPSQAATSRQPQFKLREFLGAIAMGLRPTRVWDGDTTKFSGLLVVKQNGEILFYYLYNRKNFEEHLFENVGFERPSTNRHRYGEIYSENGIDKIKLNLQIRFIN